MAYIYITGLEGEIGSEGGGVLPTGPEPLLVSWDFLNKHIYCFLLKQ